LRGLGGLGEALASMIGGLLLFAIVALLAVWLYKKYAPKNKDDEVIIPVTKSPTTI
jgi:hypothetical protein